MRNHSMDGVGANFTDHTDTAALDSQCAHEHHVARMNRALMGVLWRLELLSPVTVYSSNVNLKVTICLKDAYVSGYHCDRLYLDNVAKGQLLDLDLDSLTSASGGDQLRRLS